MSDLKQFKLPDVGEGLTEADIVRWHVGPGDKVTVNQTIVEIETAKALVELPSPYDGTVHALLVGEGETVDVGTPIISVDVAAGAGAPRPGGGAAAGPGPSLSAEQLTRAAAAPSAGPAAAPAEPQAGERQPVLVGYGIKPGTTTRRPRKKPPTGAPGAASPAPPAPPAATPAAAPAAAPAVSGADAEAVTVLAKPPVRKLARELGVDLATVPGTGPGHSITRDDVQGAARAGAPAAAGAPPALAGAPAVAGAAGGPREERIPVRGVRKHTAAAVAASAFTAPHVTEFLQIDATATMDAVRRVREEPEFAGVRVSPLLFAAKALLLAVARHPMINSSWDEDAGEIVVKRYVNLGIAAATDRGLIVPNIKEAHALTLPALARALHGLAETARSSKTAPADLQGGTITITNVGVFGVDTGTPILTSGEAAILAFGQIRDMPWVHQGELAVRKVTTLALSFDHRIVDGDLGSAVLRDVGAMLEEPVRMLAWG
jgi:2-oxoisovalerate dehydrogenase E2 component (dihydrolipoyl transacylase)